MNGTTINDKWNILNKIGEGAFGEIYSAKKIRTDELVAVKIERVNPKAQALKMEISVLKKIQDCTYVCRLLDWGKLENINYMVMDLLGENLSDLKKRCGGKFDPVTSFRSGFLMVHILEDLHSLGFIHRDLKPSNFVVGLTPEKRKNIYLIDFGLARKYIESNGDIREERVLPGFRGTARYASINSHNGKDLSRRDDLWSIFYILIEFLKGGLPWENLKDKDLIRDMKCKKEYYGDELCNGLPPQMFSYWEYIQKLEFSTKPDYGYLKGLLKDALNANGGTNTKKLAWESIDPPRKLLSENILDLKKGSEDISNEDNREKSETKSSHSPTTGTRTGGEENNPTYGNTNTATKYKLKLLKSNHGHMDTVTPIRLSITNYPSRLNHFVKDESIELEKEELTQTNEYSIDLETNEESNIQKKEVEKEELKKDSNPYCYWCNCCNIM